MYHEGERETEREREGGMEGGRGGGGGGRRAREIRHTCPELPQDIPRRHKSLVYIRIAMDCPMPPI